MTFQDSKAPVEIGYQFTRSDGAVSQNQFFTISHPGTYPISTTWTLGGAGLTSYSGWESFKAWPTGHQGGFGYSFSTWRLHLRGETIKSARDVGWVKTLTAGKMMRRETKATDAATTIAEFRRRFPLGSTSRVVLVDATGRYAGIVVPAAAFAEPADPAASIGTIAGTRDITLAPEADIAAVMVRFDEAESDELAVIDGDGQVLGILSEVFVRRRYTEELEKALRELFGER